MEFVKMHGLGNDFIIINAEKADLARKNMGLRQSSCVIAGLALVLMVWW